MSQKFKTFRKDFPFRIGKNTEKETEDRKETEMHAATNQML